jgi:hypothetical protein
MYEVLPSFVLGFHGCDHSLAEKVFAGKSRLKPSQNDYDWLGHGVYFWENNSQRALEYARLLCKRNHGKAKVVRPAVIGAIIDLGFCMNLLDSQFLQMVKDGYHALSTLCNQAGQPLPENRAVGGSKDLLLRHLDCAVVETVHELRANRSARAFESVRGAFIEGSALYPGAGFNERNHIQICVREPQCIKGYFRVLDMNGDGPSKESA